MRTYGTFPTPHTYFLISSFSSVYCSPMLKLLQERETKAVTFKWARVY